MYKRQDLVDSEKIHYGAIPEPTTPWFVNVIPTILTLLVIAVFWLSLIHIFLIKINWGEIRGYIILGFIIGAFIYLKIFSKFIYPICIKVGRIVREIIKRIVYLVFYPIKFFKSKSLPTVRKMKKISIELAKQREKYKKIISTKK